MYYSQTGLPDPPDGSGLLITCGLLCAIRNDERSSPPRAARPRSFRSSVLVRGDGRTTPTDEEQGRSLGDDLEVDDDGLEDEAAVVEPDRRNEPEERAGGTNRRNEPEDVPLSAVTRRNFRSSVVVTKAGERRSSDVLSAGASENKPGSSQQPGHREKHVQRVVLAAAAKKNDAIRKLHSRNDPDASRKLVVHSRTDPAEQAGRGQDISYLPSPHAAIKKYDDIESRKVEQDRGHRTTPTHKPKVAAKEPEPFIEEEGPPPSMKDKLKTQVDRRERLKWEKFKTRRLAARSANEPGHDEPTPPSPRSLPKSTDFTNIIHHRSCMLMCRERVGPDGDIAKTHFKMENNKAICVCTARHVLFPKKLATKLICSDSSREKTAQFLTDSFGTDGRNAGGGNKAGRNAARDAGVGMDEVGFLL